MGIKLAEWYILLARQMLVFFCMCITHSNLFYSQSGGARYIPLIPQPEYSIVLLATQILVLASVADVFLDKNEVRVRFAGSLPSLLLKIEQK